MTCRTVYYCCTVAAEYYSAAKCHPYRELEPNTYLKEKKRFITVLNTYRSNMNLEGL